MRAITHIVLADWTPADVVVHSGTLLRVGGHAGIAEVYSVARALGFTTTGIHPSVAMEFAETHRVSPDCDYPFFVEDATWGGLLSGTQELSPTLRVHLEVSDELVVIGGGKHAADELTAFTARGVKTRYFPAEMNHATTREWSERAGADIRDLRGAAHGAWESIRG